MSAADYEEMLARIASLKLRLPSLEGKANKKERTAVNKEIYTLENEPTFVEAQKSALCASRSEAAAADDAAHASRLREEAAAEAAAEAERAERLARKAAQTPAAPAEEDDENHNVVKLIRKGDGETKPAAGQQVLVTYKGTFAAETTHGGVDYSGKTFDTTWDPKRKSHKPLAFQVSLSARPNFGGIFPTCHTPISPISHLPFFRRSSLAPVASYADGRRRLRG